MNKILIVARREFLETVRTKAFVLSVVLMPAIIMAGIYGSSSVNDFAKNEELPERKLALVTDVPQMSAALQHEIDEYNQENPKRPLGLLAMPPTDTQPAIAEAAERAAAAVRDGAAFAYVAIPNGAVHGDALVAMGRTDQQLKLGGQLHDMVHNAIVAVRFATHEPPIDPNVIKYLQRDVKLETVDVLTQQPVTGNEVARVLTPFAFMFLMTVGIFGIAQGLLTSVMEEKSSRVMEVLLSAISPTQLMAGKIIGMAVVGMVLLVVWGGAGYYAAQKNSMAYLVGSYRLLYVALYFLPGFLFASSFLAAIGAACNELKEAQSMAFPLSLFNLIPMIFWYYITENPQSALSIAISFIPPITPLVMILRICADPQMPLWQIVSTQIVLWIGVGFMIWAAGKVFRVGVLMYGKPPSLRELARWVRYT